MLDHDIADLMQIIPNDFSEPVIRGGAFDDVKDINSPFGFNKCEGRRKRERDSVILICQCKERIKITESFSLMKKLLFNFKTLRFYNL